MTQSLDQLRRDRLMRITEDWASGAIRERPVVAFERSLARFDFSDKANTAALDAVVERWSDIMPSLHNCRERILAPAFARMSIIPAGSSAGLTISAPASVRGVLSLGWAERRWRSDGSLAAKIRVSAFFDAEGRLYWDFGVAGRNAPPIASLRSGVRAASLKAREYGALLDLTPSHEKAAWLALRLGGRSKDPVHYLQALRSGCWGHIRCDALTYVTPDDCQRPPRSANGVLPN